MAYRVTPPGARLASMATKNGGLGKLGVGIRVSVVSAYRKPQYSGGGYLAGNFPGGITTLEGVPTTAEIRVLWRDPAGGVMDGFLVARVNSGPDGTWRVTGLDSTQKFDVVGRLADSNDVIMSNVSPAVD